MKQVQKTIFLNLLKTLSISPVQDFTATLAKLLSAE